MLLSKAFVSWCLERAFPKCQSTLALMHLNNVSGKTIGHRGPQTTPCARMRRAVRVTHRGHVLEPEEVHVGQFCSGVDNQMVAFIV